MLLKQTLWIGEIVKKIILLANIFISPLNTPINMKNFVFISLISLFSTALFAQYCPPSSAKGVHTVQKGETLYGLSRVYKTTVAQLRQLNNMQEPTFCPPVSTSLWAVRVRHNRSLLRASL
jgi:LysM repeat protein